MLLQTQGSTWEGTYYNKIDTSEGGQHHDVVISVCSVPKKWPNSGIGTDDFS